MMIGFCALADIDDSASTAAAALSITNSFFIHNSLGVS
jgi:hypothetical protein